MPRILLVVALLACGNPATKPPPSNVVATPAIDAPPPDAPSQCALLEALLEKTRACAALPADRLQELEQRAIDTRASISEMGLDGGSTFDPEEMCADDVAYLQKVAGPTCGL